MASRERQKLQCCCCSTVTIVIVTLIATSIKPIDPNTVAIEYNPNTQSIDESKLYGPGRPFLGPGHYFVKFPTQNGTPSRVARVAPPLPASSQGSHLSVVVPDRLFAPVPQRHHTITHSPALPCPSPSLRTPRREHADGPRGAYEGRARDSVDR